MAVVTYSVPGTFTWLCPAGVSVISAAVWGSGAGSQGNAGGAGSGAAYACEPELSVTPGKLYTLTVGAPGAPGNGTSPAGGGGASVFTGDQVTVLAAGGYGAPATGTTGYGAGAPPAGNNTIAFAGGAGGNANRTDGTGGGGGSSGGSASAGNAGGNGGAFGGAGASAVTGGGPGGQGGNSGSSGSAPASGPGGGAGGGGLRESGAYGYAGQVQLTYTVSLQPAIPTFDAGYSPLPADMDSWIQSPFTFLTSKVVFRAELSASFTLVSGSALAIPFNVIDEDPYAGWQSATSSWLCPAGCTGTYEVSVTVSMGDAPDGTTALSAQLWLNGNYIYTLGTSWASTTQPSLASGSAPIQLYGGQDEIYGYAYLQSSANNSAVLTAGQRCSVEVTWTSS
jgi:hypothetical protein